MYILCLFHLKTGLLLSKANFRTLQLGTQDFFVTFTHSVPTSRFARHMCCLVWTTISPRNMARTCGHRTISLDLSPTLRHGATSKPSGKNSLFSPVFDMICCVKLLSCQWYWRVVATFQLNSTGDSIKWPAGSIVLDNCCSHSIIPRTSLATVLVGPCSITHGCGWWFQPNPFSWSCKCRQHHHMTPNNWHFILGVYPASFKAHRHEPHWFANPAFC